MPLLCALSSAPAWALEYRLNPVADKAVFGQINGGNGADGLSDGAGQSVVGVIKRPLFPHFDAQIPVAVRTHFIAN